MSSVGWIDFSSEHREKVRTVIDLLKKQGVVDELGIGVFRDSFADRMFPGVSTIQTRAKYFILTPLFIQEFERQPDWKRENRTLEDYLGDREKWSRIELARRYGDQGKARGIIGITFGERKDRDIQRPPSSVYWNGLRTFGIVRTGLSLAEFSRAISGRRSLKATLEATDHEKGDDLDADSYGVRVRVPEVDADYWNDLSITLTPDEAEFLRHQITASVPQSLLGRILLDEKATRQVLKLRRSATFADFADLPFIQHLKQNDLRQIVHHARDFWTILRGAHIRYNCLLQTRFGTEQGIAEYEQEWNDWRYGIQRFDWGGWDSEFIWQLVELHGSHVKKQTRDFVKGWIEQAGEGAHEVAECDRLVMDQERANKMSRARLRPNAANEQVRGWVGLSVLDYRLPQVRTLVEDIHRAETGKADPDAGR